MPPTTSPEGSSVPLVAISPADVVGAADRDGLDVGMGDLRSAIVAGLERGEVEAQRLDGSCEGPACWLTLARERQLEALLLPVIERRGPDFHIRLEVVSLDEGRIVAEIEGDCEICGREELLSTLTELSSMLAPRLQRLETAAAFVVLRGTPVGATIEIDGDLVGTIPWEGELPPGEHTMQVSHEGHVPLRRAVVATAGVREHLEVALHPVPPEETSPPPDDDAATARQGTLETPHVTRLAIGGALAGAGVLTLGVGAGLFAYDERPHRATCTTMGMDANGRCALQHETTRPAIVTTVVGASALVAGAVLVVDAMVRRRRGPVNARAHVYPSLGGMALRF